MWGLAIGLFFPLLVAYSFYKLRGILGTRTGFEKKPNIEGGIRDIGRKSFEEEGQNQEIPKATYILIYCLSTKFVFDKLYLYIFIYL